MVWLIEDNTIIKPNISTLTENNLHYILFSFKILISNIYYLQHLSILIDVYEINYHT